MAHREICLIPRCPEKTVARLHLGDKRVDLCMMHACAILNRHADKIEVMDTWNGIVVQDLLAGVQSIKDGREHV